MEYFAKTYRDDDRSHTHTPLDGMKRPDIPKELFKTRPPTRKELSKSVSHKKNKATPGLNALSYVPYKKCPVLIDFLHRIGIKIWETKDVPDSWAVAYIILLSKSDDLDSVSEFRPIAITSTIGKIFFSVLSDRLQDFLVHNKYIRIEIQKGFLAGMPGCIEHAFALFEALREAKEHKRQIVVTWIDLANAYGSVRHNLIQFALDWYHVPKIIQKLIFQYYEKLMAKVVTKKWSTGSFLFDIGLFQGCVLSSILFNCVFQLLLDFLKPLEHLGYSHKDKDVDLVSFLKAYADDLVLATKNPQGNQKALDATDLWLFWARMAAKPRKCVSVGFRQFDRRTESSKYIPYTDVKFTAFDPLLTIAGKPIQFIVNPTEKDDFKSKHFKFLGRWIDVLLSKQDIQTRLKALFIEYMCTIESSGLHGLMKLWLYQFYVLAFLAWPFLVQDFSHSFAEELQKSCSVQLKRWAGLYKYSDIGSLFRSRDKCGLGLTSITDQFERMQVIKCSLLKHSADPAITYLYQRKEKRESLFKVRWSGTKLSKSLDQEVRLKQLFPTQNNRQGLGSGNFKAHTTKPEQRKMVMSAMRTRSDDVHVSHASSLCMQNVWMAWYDKTIPFDLSWHNLIYGPGRHIVKFVLNSSINCVRTPSMLKLWGYVNCAICPLCGHKTCTLMHILNMCTKSLNSGRFNWRHDSVLATLQPVLQTQINTANKTLLKDRKVPHISKSFLKPGSPSPKTSGKALHRPSLLDRAQDWKLLVDFEHAMLVFPSIIFCTSKRPDIVIWSLSSKTVILVELTCPAEENIEAACLRKEARYTDLVNSCEASNWKAILLTIEVGSRGYVAFSFSKFLRKLGFSNRENSTICKDISLVVSKCSSEILASHKAEHWDRNKPLIVPDKPMYEHVEPSSPSQPGPTPVTVEEKTSPLPNAAEPAWVSPFGTSSTTTGPYSTPMSVEETSSPLRPGPTPVTAEEKMSRHSDITLRPMPIYKRSRKFIDENHNLKQNLFSIPEDTEVSDGLVLWPYDSTKDGNRAQALKLLSSLNRISG
jgi:hypothetical protein